MDFGWIFLENKRIFAKGVRDSLGVKCPSQEVDKYPIYNGSLNHFIRDLAVEFCCLRGKSAKLSK